MVYYHIARYISVSSKRYAIHPDIPVYSENISTSMEEFNLCAKNILSHIPTTAYSQVHYSLAARGGNLAKIPPNQVIDDFGRGSSVESESA